MNELMNTLVDEYDIHPISFVIKYLYNEYENDYYEVICGSRMVIRNGKPFEKYYYRHVTFIETNIPFAEWYFVKDRPEYSKW